MSEAVSRGWRVLCQQTLPKMLVGMTGWWVIHVKMSTMCFPSKGKPKDMRAGLGHEKAPGRRARGYEKEACLYRGKGLSSLKMSCLRSLRCH